MATSSVLPVARRGTEAPTVGRGRVAAAVLVSVLLAAVSSTVVLRWRRLGGEAQHVSIRVDVEAKETQQARCVEDGWPWTHGPPPLAMCSRNRPDDPWHVRRTSVPRTTTRDADDVCEPKPKCTSPGALHVRAWKLDESEEVLGTPTTRDRGSMHEWLVTFRDVGGKWYVAKDTSFFREGGEHAVKSAFGIAKLVDECGFHDIVSRPMVVDVLANVTEKDGTHVQQLSLKNAHVSEFKNGTSLESISRVGSQSKEARTHTLELVRNVSAEDVLRAAAFDFLTAQFDRVAKNVLLDDSQRIHLIDNLDSSFGKYLGLKAIEREQVHASVFLEPTSSLYVGCHVDMAKDVANYPPKLAECLAHLKGNTTRQLYVGYRLPNIQAAQLLQQRAFLLLGGIDVALAYYLGLSHLQGLSCAQR